MAGAKSTNGHSNRRYSTPALRAVLARWGPAQLLTKLPASPPEEMRAAHQGAAEGGALGLAAAEGGGEAVEQIEARPDVLFDS